MFRAFLEYAAARNHLTGFIDVLPAVVAPNTSRSYAVNVALSGSWGQAGVHVQQHLHHQAGPMLQVRGPAGGESTSCCSQSLCACVVCTCVCVCGPVTTCAQSSCQSLGSRPAGIGSQVLSVFRQMDAVCRLTECGWVDCLLQSAEGHAGPRGGRLGGCSAVDKETPSFVPGLPHHPNNNCSRDIIRCIHSVLWTEPLSALY